VELLPANGNDAFQIQPITIPAGVTLLVDPGATCMRPLTRAIMTLPVEAAESLRRAAPGASRLLGQRRSECAIMEVASSMAGRGHLTGLTSSWCNSLPRPRRSV